MKIFDRLALASISRYVTVFLILQIQHKLIQFIPMILLYIRLNRNTHFCWYSFPIMNKFKEILNRSLRKVGIVVLVIFD